MDRLAGLLALHDASDVISAACYHWWIEDGPVDHGKLVTIQRGDALIAAVSARDDGRLRAAVFRPFDAKSAECRLGLGQAPHPEHGVCMRENNWEYALDCSTGNDNHYAATSTRPTCSTGRRIWASVGTAPMCPGRVSRWSSF